MGSCVVTCLLWFMTRSILIRDGFIHDLQNAKEVKGRWYVRSRYREYRRMTQLNTDMNCSVNKAQLLRATKGQGRVHCLSWRAKQKLWVYKLPNLSMYIMMRLCSDEWGDRMTCVTAWNWYGNFLNFPRYNLKVPRNSMLSTCNTKIFSQKIRPTALASHSKVGTVP